jgi:hypothetical protein
MDLQEKLPDRLQPWLECGANALSDHPLAIGSR